MSDPTTEIPEGAIALPSGGWARFIPFDDVLGKMVRHVRKGLDKDGAGSIANDVLGRALEATVIEWLIPYQPGLGIPSMQPAALDLLRGGDLRALEMHVQPWVASLTADTPVPPQPASA